jgi:N-acetylmuramoyl-L-alanine amidase
MNKFQESKYSGLQVYYSKNNDLSKELALTVQDNVKSLLQKENKRKIKAADSSIHILNSLECPAVLIECGFLSNEQELKCLKNESYRASLSLIIFSSILENKME